MVRCAELMRSSWPCVIAPALLACGSEEAPLVEEGALAAVAQPIIGLELRSEVPACTSENQSEVYYVRSEEQLYYCDGSRLRALATELDPSWLSDSIAAPAALCPDGGVVLRSGPDLDRDQRLSSQEIMASSPVCKGEPEQEGLVGERVLTGAQGEQGTPGAAGPQGPVGLQGPVGPAGPAGAGAEPEGPAPYVGDFVLEIGGFSGSVALSSFAGCFDELVGILYEDCHFQVVGLPAPVLSWLAETLGGDEARRELTVRELDGRGAVAAQLRIGAGWIRELRVSDFDAAANSAGTLSFVVVPDLLAPEAPSPVPAAASAPLFAQGDFTLDIPGVDGSGIVALSGLRLTRDLVSGTGPDPERNYFKPGQLLFDELTLVAAQSRSTQTLADLSSWIDELEGSGSDARDAVLTISSGSGPVAEMHLDQLLPFTGLGLVGERRALALRLESFDLVPLP